MILINVGGNILKSVKPHVFFKGLFCAFCCDEWYRSGMSGPAVTGRIYSHQQLMVTDKLSVETPPRRAPGRQRGLGNELLWCFPNVHYFYPRSFLPFLITTCTIICFQLFLKLTLSKLKIEPCHIH